ncbi:MAG: hypothetical protein KBC41_01240 [Candidatus Pacebacteria bacterium]|nr:hypothetical protein [Candidatus Paceibacterota bacterium]MBP9866687.1 hypothetical protein [Candidatus Paceibacterota bacterium]
MNRRLLFAVAFTLLFAVCVIIWFFVYATPRTETTLGKPVDPFAIKELPKKFQFLKSEGEIPVSTSTTEMTFAKPEILTQIWNRPTTGQTFIEKSIVQEIQATTTKGTTTISIKKLIQATSTTLMFVDRITGYIYGYNRESTKIYQISNSTIPGIYDAYIFNNGKQILFRYEDTDTNTIVTELATIPSVGEKEEPKSLENRKFLPEGVTSIALNSKKTLASYLVTSNEGSSIYTIRPSTTDFIASSPHTSWKLSYSGDALFATTKPSAYVEGYTVKIPSFEFIIGNKTGLESNPSEKGTFISSMWSNTGLKTFLSLNGNQKVLDIKTLSSKCAWGQKEFLVCAVPKTLTKSVEGLPDDWFQGRFFFDDSFVTVDTITGEILPLYTFDTTEKGIFDVINISLSKDNSMVTFLRKQDYTLWLLDTNLFNAE